MMNPSVCSSAASDAYGKVTDRYDEDCACSYPSDYYSTIGAAVSSSSNYSTVGAMSSSSMLSSTSISMDGIDRLLDISNNAIQPISQDETFLALARSSEQSESDADSLPSQPNDSNIYTYPSGRPPLVPLDWDRKSNGRKLSGKDQAKSKSKHGDKEVTSGEDMSWISRTLCIVHTPFNTVDHIDDKNNATCVPNSDSDLLIGKRVSDHTNHEVSRQNYSDVYFGSSSSYDTTKDVKQPKNPVSGEGLVHNDNEKTQSPLLYEEISDKIQLNLEVLASLNNFFTENSVLCKDWSSWYNEMKWSSWYNEIEQNSEVTQAKPNFYQSRDLPYNSTSNLAARKKRIEYLRRNLTPFESDRTELNQGVINMQKYSRLESHDVKFSLSNAFVASSNSEKPKADVPLMKSSRTNELSNECSPLIDTSCGNISDTKDIGIVPSEEEMSYDEEDDNFCYDSDPSELMHFDRSLMNTRSSKSQRSRKRLQVNVDDIDEVTCLQKISEHMNTKRLLVWHRGSTEETADPPIAVLSWIEHGSQLDSGLIQPKFCWRRSYGKESHSKSVLNISRYHGIDLLDISRIVAADNYVERNFYPFVKRKNSFIIEAFEQELVFEARDEAERDDIVEGLKLLVARLGSKIIMGDGRVLDEFFSPMGASVPGRIPSILRMES